MGYDFLKFVLLLFAGLVSGCSNDSTESATRSPAVIRIAPLPDTNPEASRLRYQAIADFIAKQTGIETKLVITSSYKKLLQLFAEKKIDIVKFGAVTFLEANNESGAIPMVMRNIDTQFTSYVIVSADAKEGTLQQLQGKPFAFGSRLSTSGHLMPRYFFNKEGITPETYFSRIEYSGAHDKTAYLVRDKKVHAGAANSVVINQMLSDGRLNKSNIRVLWESQPYTDYVWAIQPDIATSVKAKIEKAFLSLQVSNPEHKVILDKLGAKYFVTANQGDFVLLGDILEDFRKQGIIE